MNKKNIENKALESVKETLNFIQVFQRDNTLIGTVDIMRHIAVYLRAITILHKTKNTIIISVKTDEEMTKVNLLKDSSYVLHQLTDKLVKQSEVFDINKYIEISTNILSSSKTPIALKTQLLDIENKNIPHIIDKHLTQYHEAKSAISTRYNLCKKALETKNITCFSENKEPIKRLLSTYISKLIEAYVDKGQLLQAQVFLYKLIQHAKSDEEQEVLCRALISHSTSFHLSTTNELNLLLEEFEHLFSDEDISLFKSEINFTPDAIVVSNFNIGNGTLSKETTSNKNFITTISFSIPQKPLSKQSIQTPINATHSLRIEPISTFWEDPIFKVLRNYKIANMSWCHFCDIEPKNGSSYSHIQIAINGLFTPDITLTDKGNSKIDFSEKEALMGRSYYPHKEFIIKFFIENFEAISKHLEIDKNDININIFSNYVVQHINKENGEVVHRQVFTITNPDSFSLTTSRFIDRLNSINLSDSLVNIREMLTRTKIVSEKNLADFVYRSFDVFVKQNIENHGDYQYLWTIGKDKNPKPCKETECQPYIFNHLRAFFDFMGIQISRESISSNGEIDFLVSYRNNDHKLLKICVELKLAHAQNVENGIKFQLPQYMKGERCNYGIFVALWFKGDQCNKPLKYETPQELHSFLDKEKLIKRIKTIVIDCVKPISPSKLKKTISTH